MSWMTWVLFVGLLWIYPVCGNRNNKSKTIWQKLKYCLNNNPTLPYFVVPDQFSAFITADEHWNLTKACILFVQRNVTRAGMFEKKYLQVEGNYGSYVLRLTRLYIRKKLHLYVVDGRKCNTTLSGFTDSTAIIDTLTEPCWIRGLDTKIVCKEASYDVNNCKADSGSLVKDKFIINITTTTNNKCVRCDNPEKLPEDKVKVAGNYTPEEGEHFDAAEAARVMNKMADLASSINVSWAALTVAEGVTGILVRKTDPVDVAEVVFGYWGSNDSIRIVDGSDNLAQYSRSVSVPKEAFEKSLSLNVSVQFVVLLRFTNLALDMNNSTILGDEVLAVEMGATIINLTDKICINFKNIKDERIPSCRSWNGDGSRPNWTDGGCRTIKNGTSITCECSHLTFFAVLLAPLNETIPSADLKNLTIITQVGCGLSMFFLGVVLFMHFLMRKTKASISTKILIHMVSAMFLLNLTFLLNNFVAKMDSSVGCKSLAALMHYFMLATFSWFAVQAFHLGLQLYVGGKIVIRHYILKVSVTSWVLPSVVVIVLLILGKYGKQSVYTSDTEEIVAMCWITDNDVQYIVNIGYYALVFLFTCTTFNILSWLFCLKRMGSGVISTNTKSIAIILGLCCMMGITWGFAFFAYGVLRIPAYYIFTVLNSFQGFFLFIYYYNTSHSEGIIDGQEVSVSTDTLQTSVQSCENPYANFNKEQPR
ncbi:adhesion G-protein coupled receptor G6-like [Anarrhichthys ocellatus]|uniref:adhesion G-protein coupled receptor G6-like n=1 Tax=Anarrhichthys ocellatus TaxID=433405 RepID=UPI0012EE15B8|nr:adhesion G-protein coupled receptor G6-like [Anarrhichthys ocellatus]